MTRGKKSEIGDTRIAKNGYHYTRTTNGWELTHRLTAQLKLKRALDFNERVKFVDGDRSNYADPDNLDVYRVRETSDAKKRARLESRIDELQAELKELDDV